MDATAWERKADLHERDRDYCNAVAAWDRAVRLSPRADLRARWGWALQRLGQLESAAEQFRAALEMDLNCPLAHLHLGGLHEELGNMTAAETEYRRALVADERFALPFARLGMLLRARLPVGDLAAIRDLLGSRELPDEQRCELHFAHAHVLDARGEYPEAAAESRSANRLLQASFASESRSYSPATYRKFADQHISTFTPALFAHFRGVGLQTRRPVFVFGLPRSGTTLVEQILSSHSAVFGAGELPIASDSFTSLVRSSAGRPGAPLTADALRQVANSHNARLDAIDGGRHARIVDKQPDNYYLLGLLWLLFPSATYIHCRRDLRDTALSCWMTDFRATTWASDPAMIASHFADYRRIMQHWASALPATVHHVDYEQLVTDPEPAARRLISACGLEWENKCLEHHRNPRPVRTASLTQVRQPIFASSVGRWKNYEHLLPELFAGLPGSPAG